MNIKERAINLITSDLTSKRIDFDRYENDINDILNHLKQLSEQEKEEFFVFLTSLKVQYNNKQNSSKVINNSVYGYSGYKSSRFYNPHLAEAIAQSGAELTTGMMEFIENELDIEIIYGDTDSIFLSLDNVIPEDIKTNGDIDEIRKFINDFIQNNLHKRIDDFIYEIMKRFVGKKYKEVPKFEFKQEIIAEKGIFLKGKASDVAKKKYILRIIDEEGVPKDELFFRGIDIRKAELSKDIKALMRKIIEIIMFSDDITQEVIKRAVNELEKAVEVVYNWVENLEIDKIAEYKNISKTIEEYKTDTLNKRALEIYNEVAKFYNLPAVEGNTKLKIIYIKPRTPLTKVTNKLIGKFKSLDVIGIPTDIQVPKGTLEDIFVRHFSINADEIIQKQFISRIETLFATLGVDVNKLKLKQSKLNKRNKIF